MMKKRWVALVYSENWVHQTALEHICQADSQILSVQSFSGTSGCSKKRQAVPDIVILDISPRKYVMLILKIRQTWPGVYIFFTRPAFLFSERVVADFFGGIWLKEYDAIMSGWPEFCFSHCLTSPTLSGAYAPVKMIHKQSVENEVISELEIFLHERLSHIISLRASDIVFRWLLSKLSLSEICQQSGLKEKTIYHYREETMRRLQIRHYSRDFSTSLTVSSGRVPSFLM
ncbi:hypothetical protein [Citrobacter portucalensis]|uniref:hypothetical protein n=1 Tax=Citrobacter portucalensis TaxID=1639133 RepID=UPI00288AB84A|nr:hypothetical protein [Citrobacter portucalensis]WNI88062.1 hypothetical protein RIK60_09985 [Citrobacter portucalensis]